MIPRRGQRGESSFRRRPQSGVRIHEETDRGDGRDSLRHDDVRRKRPCDPTKGKKSREARRRHGLSPVRLLVRESGPDGRRDLAREQGGAFGNEV